MHSRGDILEIASYSHATYGDVVGEVTGGAARRARRAPEPRAWRPTRP